ncbi:MAG: trypsin-like peptidase domain-containing protein, partial [bacterium]
VVFEERPRVVELPEQVPVQLPGALAAACAATPRAFGTPIACAKGSAKAIGEAVRWSVAALRLPRGEVATAFLIAEDLILTVGHIPHEQESFFGGPASGDMVSGNRASFGWIHGNHDDRLVPNAQLLGWTDWGLVGQPTLLERTAARLEAVVDFFAGDSSVPLDGALDYSVWRIRLDPSNTVPVTSIELRTFGTGVGDWVYMVGHGTDGGGHQYPLEVSRSKLAGHFFWGEKSYGGFMEARVNSVPGCSGSPWLDPDGCAVGVNKEGYRGFRRVHPRPSEVEEGVDWFFYGGPVDARRDSWATPMLNIMVSSPNVRAAIGRTAPRALRCRPWLADVGISECLFFRDDVNGHLLVLSSSRYDWGDVSEHSWVQKDLTVLHEAASPVRGATLAGWTNDRGVCYVAYLSDVSDEGGRICGLPTLLPKLLFSSNGFSWAAVEPNFQALVGALSTTLGGRPVRLEPGFFTAWYRPATRTAHMIVGDRSGAVFHLSSVDNDRWNALLVTEGADTSVQGGRALAGWARGNLCSVVVRMSDGVLAHFEWRNAQWVRRRNTAVPRGADRVAVAVVVIPADAAGGLEQERVYASFEFEGAEHLMEMRFDSRRNQWESTGVDFHLEAGGDPLGTNQQQRTLSAALQVLESVTGLRGARPGYLIRLAYPTQREGRSGVAVIRFMSQRNQWDVETLGTVLGANVQLSHLGNTGNDRFCLVGGDGRLDWMVPYTGRHSMRRYCLSDRTGMPLGWCYLPGRAPAPKSHEARMRRGPCG